MSVTVTHRPHVHVPWLPVIVLLAIAVAAVLVVALIVESSETTSAGTGAQDFGATGTSVATPDLPKNRSPVVRAFILGGAPAAAAEASTPPRKYCRAPWAAYED